MIKELQITRIESVETFKREEKELHALEIIKKYITMNRAFKDQTKGQSNLTLIEIKALIPDEEYDLLKEVLKI